MTVLERVAEAGDADDVGVFRTEAQHPFPVAPHHQRDAALDRAWIALRRIIQGDVVTGVGHGLGAAQEGGGRFHQLHHASDPSAGAGEPNPTSRPFLRGVARPDSEHRPSPRDEIHGRHCVGEGRRFPHASVEDTGSEPDAVGDRCRGGQRDKRVRRDARVVAHVQPLEPGRLHLSRKRQP